MLKPICVGKVEIPVGLFGGEEQLQGVRVARVVGVNPGGIEGVTFEFRKPGVRTSLAGLLWADIWHRATLLERGGELGGYHLSTRRPMDKQSTHSTRQTQ